MPSTLWSFGRMLVSALCIISASSCQQRVVKGFPGHGYLHLEDRIVGLSHFLVNLDICCSPFYVARGQSQYVMLIGRNHDFSTLCHRCGFACQQSLLETFCCPGCVRVWDSSVTIGFLGSFRYVYMYIYSL